MGKKRFGLYLKTFVTLGCVGGEVIIGFLYKMLEYEYDVMVSPTDDCFITSDWIDQYVKCRGVYRDKEVFPSLFPYRSVL